jgi:hypothetical protein
MDIEQARYGSMVCATVNRIGYHSCCCSRCVCICAPGSVIYSTSAVDGHRDNGDHYPFPEDVKKWMFGAAKNHKFWFNFLMDDEGDQPVSFWYIVALAALAVICRVLLYAAYVFNAANFIFVTNLFVPLTFLLNIAVYIFFGLFASKRRQLDQLIEGFVMQYCPEVVQALKLEIQRTKDMRAATLADKTVANMRTNGAKNSTTSRRPQQSKPSR